MGSVIYNGLEVPVFESYTAYGEYMYGISLDKNEEGYFLFKVSGSEPMGVIAYFKVEKGTALEIETNKKDGLFLRAIPADGSDSMIVPIKGIERLESKVG